MKTFVLAVMATLLYAGACAEGHEPVFAIKNNPKSDAGPDYEGCWCGESRQEYLQEDTLGATQLRMRTAMVLACDYDCPVGNVANATLCIEDDCRDCNDSTVGATLGVFVCVVDGFGCPSGARWWTDLH
jgi:hypothetical protein